MSSGVVAINAHGAVVMLNPGAQRILGCPQGEPRATPSGKHCREVLRRATRQLHSCLLDTLDGRQAALSRAELALECVQGRVREHDRFYADAGARFGWVEVCAAAIIFRDLTPLGADGGARAASRERLAASRSDGGRSCSRDPQSLSPAWKWWRAC